MRPATSTSCRSLASVAALCIAMFFPAASYGLDPVDELLDRSEQEGNGEELVELLHELRNRPVPVNTATERELLRLPLLSAGEASKIVEWRNSKGLFASPEELSLVIGPGSADRISPYLSFDLPRATPGKSRRDGFQGSLYGRFFQETPPRKGIQTGKYEGENRRLFSRIEASMSNFGASFVQESDIGEPDAGDFLSFSLHADRIGIMTRAVAGNYRISFGQGLLFGQGRYFSKGTDPVDGVMLFSSSVRPYTSSSEDNFLQGAAVTLNPGPFELTAFASGNRLDATIADGVATSVSTEGYHRTASEQARKDTLPLETEGMNLRCLYRGEALDAGVGVTLMRYRYGKPVDWLSDGGQERNGGSVEASLLYGAVQVFGEAAFSSRPDAVSWICGLQAKLGKGIDGVASLRRYAVDYFSPFAGAFAERGDDGSNEEGCYLGISAKVQRNLELGVSYDMFRFPELRSTYPLPSSGHDARLNVTWKQSPSMVWSGLYQHRQKEEALIQQEDGGWLEYVMPVPKTTNRVQLNLELKASSMFSFKTRGEYKSVESRFASGKETDRGWLLYWQLKSKMGRFALSSRYTRFSTDSFDAAVYVYEDDLPQVYSLGSFSGRGQAMFVLASYEPLSNFRLTAKYETTWYADRDFAGSGNDLRATSSPGSFNLGAMWKF